VESKGQFAAKRLLPGQDLKHELLVWAKENSWMAAVVVSSVGSLSEVRLRLANTQPGASAFLEKKGPFEILSLNGTLSAQGLHMHLAVADSTGHCWGGHLVEGNRIYTTCELIIADCLDFQFARELDSHTGFRELTIRRPTNRSGGG